MKKFQENQNIEEELNLKFILNLILRNKFLITLIVFIGTLGGYLYTSSLPKIWEGSFQIVIRNENRESNRNEIFSQIIFNSQANEELLTEKSILNSPSVLMPVFEYVKNKSNSENLTFKSWRNSALDINFEEGTAILNVTYKSFNKELITKVLEMISSRYKEYSTSDKEKNIVNSISYLNDQENLFEKRSIESMKRLNEFAIENGLGDIDGFISLKEEIAIKNEISQSENLSSDNPNLYKLKIKDSSKSGQRFASQFRLLEEYETKYIDLSSKLKPNSSTLNNLKIKIDNLKDSLKRPNEILIKYRELIKIANRDEIILNTIKQNLNLLNLEKQRYLEPWKLISNPELDENSIYPNIPKNTILFFLASFFVSLISAMLIEKKSGIIYELGYLKYLVKTNYLNEIFINDLELSKKLINKNFNNSDTQNSKLNLGIVLICGEKINSVFSMSKLFIKNPKYKFFDLNNINMINETDKLIIVVEVGEITLKQVDKLNIFLELYKDKFIGWSSIDKLMI